MSDLKGIERERERGNGVRVQQSTDTSTLPDYVASSLITEKPTTILYSTSFGNVRATFRTRVLFRKTYRKRKSFKGWEVTKYEEFLASQIYSTTFLENESVNEHPV